MAMKLHLFILVSFLLVAASTSATLMKTKYPPGTAPGVQVVKTSATLMKTKYPPSTAPGAQVVKTSATLMKTKYPPGTAPGVQVVKTLTTELRKLYPPGTAPGAPVLFTSKSKTTLPMVKPPTTTSLVAKPPTSTPVATPPLAAPPIPPRNTKECYPICVVRCKFHSRQNVCLRACVTCCDRCKCVPPGQSGNQEVCGKCYTNMKTHGGRPKCP